MSEKTLDKHRLLRWLVVLASVAALALFFCVRVQAAQININLDPDTSGDSGLGTLQLVFLFTLLAVAPSLLVMMTSFTRIIIVLSLLRNALGVAQAPPNQVLIGLALFMTLFIMTPTLTEVNEQGLEPYSRGEITQEVAVQNMERPLKVFMLKQIKAEDLNLFLSLMDESEQITELNPEALTGIALRVIVPAFITSELRQAFIIGFLLFLPFLVIDMIVASTLMSMGMVMLPPSMVSLPFKLMLFVVVDGWDLVIQALISSFHH